MAWDEQKYIGRDNAANGISTSNVVANADGSLLERIEWVQTALGGAASQLKWQQSATGVVEETDIVRFSVSLFDIDDGAIASANIDITGITQTMERSRNGSSYSAISDPTVTFSKADGLVYIDYEFKAAQWQVGDMYRMTLSGIECTLHSDTAYVPATIWCNTVQEAEDLTLNTQYLYGVADGGTTSPTKVLDNSILSMVLTKESGGDTSDYDNSTDSLEAISDKVGAYTGDGGVDFNDSILANLTKLSTYLADGDGDYATGTALPSDTSLYDTTKQISIVAVDGTTPPVPNTISDILHKDTSYTYSKTTDSLEAISDAITEGSLRIEADAGSTASVIIDAAALTQTTTDWWKGALLLSINGNNSGQARPVVSFNATTDAVTVSPPFLAAPTAGDDFLIISGFKMPEWVPVAATAINATAVVSPGVDLLDLVDTNGKTSYRLNNLRIKCADPGANTVTITLYELINDVSTAVNTFVITTDNYETYYSLMDMFGLTHVSGDDITINATTSAGSYAVTGNYQYDSAFNA